MRSTRTRTSPSRARARRCSAAGRSHGAGDPTDGGKRGEIGETPSIAADEPDDGSAFPVGGGTVTEEEDAPPVADPGPDA